MLKNHNWIPSNALENNNDFKRIAAGNKILYWIRSEGDNITTSDHGRQTTGYSFLG